MKCVMMEIHEQQFEIEAVAVDCRLTVLFCEINPTQH